MSGSFADIAASFDGRAATYDRNAWHRQCAEQLVAFSRIRRGAVVLDAGTGTGFAALAASRSVGVQGRIVAVDLSGGMLDVARLNPIDGAMAAIEWRQLNAVALHDYADGSFDAVLSSAALLYMPVEAALAEWHRVLKPGGDAYNRALRSFAAEIGCGALLAAQNRWGQVMNPERPRGTVGVRS